MPAVDLGNVGFAIVCGRGQRKLCSICGRPGGKLCDPAQGGKAGQTCDRSLCARCAVHRAPDTDYCPAHARMIEGAL
jgi:hypothetical protein